MKHLHFSLSAFLVAALPVMALAQTVSSGQEFPFDDISVGAYTDSPWDQKTNVAVSALTRMGVVVGNDDGTFAPDRRLNRAEFVTIVMRLLSDNGPISLDCFPDVSLNAWYAEDVCRAKSIGLVRGNVDTGVPSAWWRFEPSRDIQYEEAVKILVELYALPISGDTEGSDWYTPYIRAAQTADVDLNGRAAGDHLTRGEMARLTIAFVAQSQDRLDELRDAESGSSSNSSRSSSSRTSSSSSKSSSMSSSSRSSSSTSTTAIRSQILLLGEVSPIIAGVNFFSNSEPVDIDAVDIQLTAPSDSIGSILVYDENGTQIGTATAVAGSTSQFHGTIGFGNMLLPYREERHMYLRARLKNRDTGGESGENIRVQSIEISGEGRWSSEEYSTTSNETFPEFETAFARITSVTNAGSSEGVLGSGPERLLADFNLTAQSPEALYNARLTSLDFTYDHSSGVSVTNVDLRTDDGSNVGTDCTVSTNTITCSGIDPSIGTIDDTRRLRLFGDVTVAGSPADPYLMIVLNQPGTPTTPGAITWTDGSTTFTWVDLSQPVANGTNWQ